MSPYEACHHRDVGRDRMAHAGLPLPRRSCRAGSGQLRWRCGRLAAARPHGRRHSSRNGFFRRYDLPARSARRLPDDPCGRSARRSTSHAPSVAHVFRAVHRDRVILLRPDPVHSRPDSRGAIACRPWCRAAWSPLVLGVARAAARSRERPDSRGTAEHSMSTTEERRAAIALLIGVIAPLLIMGMHPTGADITIGGARLVMINHMVHGVSLAAQPVVFLGLLGLWRRLHSDVATAALVFYAFGIVAILSAAVLSGFVAPEVVAERPLLFYTGQLNQGFAKVSVAAIGASLILWGAALRFARLPAAAGVIIGAVLVLGVLTGWLHLSASGIVIVTLLQGIWIILVAAQLLRGGFNGRD